MRVGLIFIIFCFLFLSCDNKNKDSRKYLRTDKINDVYYCEHFNVDSYGVGGDVYNLYLTDSLTFRDLVCTYYDNDVFEYLCENDKIKILKYEDSSNINGKKVEKKLSSKYEFDLDDLKKRNSVKSK
jgi:hypothetical protein